jgi:hypothetical protein
MCPHENRVLKQDHCSRVVMSGGVLASCLPWDMARKSSTKPVAQMPIKSQDIT